MHATVNETCISCGLCASICPEVFHLSDQDGQARGGHFEEALLPQVQEARDSCPVSAISLE